MPRSMKRKRKAGSNPKPLAGRDPTLLNRRPPNGQTSAQFGAAMLVDGLVPHAVVAREWARAPMGPRERMDLTSTLERIEETARRVSAGDLSHAEAVLTAQTVTLNAMFANLACRATEATGVDHFDRYMRLAFKAQSQCRATSRRWPPQEPARLHSPGEHCLSTGREQRDDGHGLARGNP